MSRHYLPELNEVFYRSRAPLLQLKHRLADVFGVGEVALEEVSL